ncbi:MAG: ABC transporter permease [Pseudomonadales bacterium]
MLELQLAWRNLLRQRRRSILTGLSIAGGYFLITFAVSLIEGSYGNMIELFTRDRVGHVQIHALDYRERPRTQRVLQPASELLETLQGPSDVVGVAPRILTAALAYGDEKSSPVQIVGIDPALEPTVTHIQDKVMEGAYFPKTSLEFESEDSDVAPALIGVGIARALDIGLGDPLILIGQGADGSIANDQYVVIGLVGNERSADRMTVYLPILAAQRFLSLGDAVHEIALRLENISGARSKAAMLQSTLPELDVAPWQEIEATFFQTMQADREGNQFGLFMIIFLVFIGVLNTVLMSVLERTREFGVLRAMGCRPTRLVRLVALETMMLSASAILMGLISVLPLIYWFTQVGFELPEPIDMGGVAFSHYRGMLSSYVFLMPMCLIFVSALVVSLPPGLRAARVKPVEAMRHY